MNTAQKNKIYWINLITIILISLNLRVPITSIGPIADLLQTHYQLNATQISLLTSLPLFAFGSISFIVAFFQPLKAMIFGLLFIFFGEILRIFDSNYALFIGTMIVGVGIAIANVLLPSLIKAKFPRQIPKIMGFYSLALNISAALGMVTIIPLTHIIPIPYTLLIWSIFAILAIISFIPQIKNNRITRFQGKKIDIFSIFKKPDAWKISFFMGLTSFLAYSFMAWYPNTITSLGYDKNTTAHLIFLSQCIVIPFSFFAPIVLGNIAKNHRIYFIIILCNCYTLGFLLLFFSQNLWEVILATILTSIPVGGVFSIALLFISSKSSSVKIATKLSAMAQGVGYSLASFGPLAIGAIYDYFHNFQVALILLASCGVILSILGIFVHKISPIK